MNKIGDTKNIEVILQDLDMMGLTDEQKLEKLKDRIFVLNMLLEVEKDELKKLTPTKLEEDSYDGFDDPDEQLTDEEINDLINYQFQDMNWNHKEKKFDDLMKEGQPHTQRGFYCYVISQMSDEELEPYINDYVDWLERMNYDNEINKLPNHVKQDKDVMNLRKKQIEDDGKRLGNQVIDDLFSFIKNKGLMGKSNEV